ncbi:hypothetical protein HPP92_006837 [Vanilla planifolia]|uniref:Uncharacterized protein n=1 Tax=Vanilla planifolia TaxID=51239 RepID=A0A835RJ60_VANPL|nr:hypothetical protein HPP92_006837 [Vanilla planifolia]
MVSAARVARRQPCTLHTTGRGTVLALGAAAFAAWGPRTPRRARCAYGRAQ